MTPAAKRLLDKLCKEYMEKCADRPRFQAASLGGRYNSIYLHKTPFRGICIKSVLFSEKNRGQGVFTGFIEFIKQNPSYFKGIVVDSIRNERLAKKLLREGFVFLDDGGYDYSFPPLVFPLTEDCPRYDGDSSWDDELFEHCF